LMTDQKNQSTAIPVQETKTLRSEAKPGKPPKERVPQDNLPKWGDESLALVQKLPQTFGTLRADKTQDWKASILAVQSDGHITKVVLPTLPPDTHDEKIVSGFILQFCLWANWKVEDCTASSSEQKQFWANCVQMKDALHGAFLCLNRNTIEYVDNIPKSYEMGWEFAFWYCQAESTKILDSNELLKPKKVSNITLTGQVWGQGSSITLLTRVNNLIRAASKAQSVLLGDIHNMLKSKQHVVNTFCGKRPVRGLYTEEEFVIANDGYNSKVERIGIVYSNIPKSHKLLGPSGLHTYFAEFSVKSPAQLQLIEDTKSKRIPDLLVTTRMGKKQVSEIAKGGSLSEKLITIGGGNSVRTIGKVLWSPTSGISQVQFTNAVMTIAVECYHNSFYSQVEVIDKTIEDLKVRDKSANWERARDSIHVGVTTYLEIIPGRESDPSWAVLFRSNKGKRSEN